ncbi:AAA family ATPase [Bacteroides congonensis]|uniref:AAA family ATPase n=1 Tax=Bacteroides congonensis TaxID=1871006 RepID=UPI00189F6DA5|nr:ATP-binding protein [Bacteroides congonensis]
MSIVNNPFIVGGYLSPHYFCDRETETEQLIRNITNGRNVVIISVRRMGKTGLIRHCFYQDKIKENYHTFFIDIYATSSLREFVFALGKEIFERLKPKGMKFIERFFSIISSLRAGFKLDTITGEPTFDIGLGDIHAAETTLDEIFAYLEQADKPCIVAIDEFQQIGNYAEKNVEAILRTKVQHCQNARFIFAGSQKHIMMNMFNSPARPFYQSVNMMQLKSIPLTEYKAFVKRLFLENEKHIEEELIDEVYNFFEGHTWYIQLMFNELYILTGKGELCSRSQQTIALTNILQMQDFTYQEIFSRLPEKQKEVLIAIGKEQKAIGVTSGKFIKKYKLSTPSSVQSALKGLLEKNLVSQEQNQYEISDRLLGVWLQKNY